MVTKLKTPTILCDSASADWGKTTFIKAIDAKLSNNSQRFTLLNIKATKWKYDIFKVYQDTQNGNREIIISSKGDDKDAYDKIEDYLKTHNNVWAILTASRPKTKRTTSSWKTITNIAQNYGFVFYAYSNFHTTKSYPDPICDSFNAELIEIITNSL